MADNGNNYTVKDLQDNLDYLQETKTQIKNAIIGIPATNISLIKYKI